ncbi:MAG: hypothetical protein M0P58_02995 [Bacteroidales bacterium]|nr:hypothetical protein [Bacteroidales bacterium]
MKKNETGEYLLLIYRKRIASLLANIYKAGCTRDPRIILRVRLDLNKIYALFGLFEMIDPNAFKKQAHYLLFKKLLKYAEKIRHVQVNYLLLDKNDYYTPKNNPFILWLNKEEINATHKFLKAIKLFNDEELSETEKKIEKICYSNSMLKLRSKTDAFIFRKAVAVDTLLSDNIIMDKKLNKVKRHLKLMSTVCTLVITVKPKIKLDRIVTALNRTEMMIGDWYDGVILQEAIGRFLRLDAPESIEERNPLTQLRQQIIDHDQNLVQHFLPEVKALVRGIIRDNS